MSNIHIVLGIAGGLVFLASTHWFVWIMGWGKGVEDAVKESIRPRASWESWYRDLVKYAKEGLL
jgi:hypothetical protein